MGFPNLILEIPTLILEIKISIFFWYYDKIFQFQTNVF